MAKKTSKPKAKEPIRLRFKKLANGNFSIYLDKYIGYEKDENGKVKTKHEYEFLKMYLIPETDEAAKIANENTLEAATQFKARRIIELNNRRAGLQNTSDRSKMLLKDWMEIYRAEKEKTGQSTRFADKIADTMKHLSAYKGDKVIMAQVDKDFCKGYIEYLRAFRKPNGEPLKDFTLHTYYKMFSCALNMAVREDVIPMNPFTKLDPKAKPQAPESTREFLSVDEVKALIKTDCKNDVIKRAFLFSCFCGLRHSDLMALTWGDIEKNGTDTFLNIIVKKTAKPLRLALSPTALRWLPNTEKAKPTDKVFVLPKMPHYHNRVLKKWAKDAGITKTVSFHVARHTFATLELTAGADIYTTSKLLGHSNVKTTQIYAKIIDKKQVNAVNLVSQMFE
jgi:integrase